MCVYECVCGGEESRGGGYSGGGGMGAVVVVVVVVMMVVVVVVVVVVEVLSGCSGGSIKGDVAIVMVRGGHSQRVIRSPCSPCATRYPHHD